MCHWMGPPGTDTGNQMIMYGELHVRHSPVRLPAPPSSMIMLCPFGFRVLPECGSSVVSGRSQLSPSTIRPLNDQGNK